MEQFPPCAALRDAADSTQSKPFPVSRQRSSLDTATHRPRYVLKRVSLKMWKSCGLRIRRTCGIPVAMRLRGQGFLNAAAFFFAVSCPEARASCVDMISSTRVASAAYVNVGSVAALRPLRALEGNSCCKSSKQRTRREPLIGRDLNGAKSRDARCRTARLGPLMQFGLGAGGEDSVCDVPDGLEQAVQQLTRAMTSALLSGKRGLLVDVLVPEADPMSRGFEPQSLLRLTEGVITSLSRTSSGPFKLVLQDMEQITKALVFLRESNVTAPLLEDGLLGVGSLAAVEGPSASSGGAVVGPEDAVVILVAPSNKGARMTGPVRGVLMAAEARITVVLNQCLDATGDDGRPVGILPIELLRFEPVYCVQPLALAASAPKGMRPADGAAPSSRRIAITRAFPGEWGTFLWEDDDQRYDLLETSRNRYPPPAPRPQPARTAPSPHTRACRFLQLSALRPQAFERPRAAGLSAPGRNVGVQSGARCLEDRVVSQGCTEQGHDVAPKQNKSTVSSLP